MACQTILAGMMLSITGIQNSHGYMNDISYTLGNTASECELSCTKCATCKYAVLSSDDAMGKPRGWEICDVSLEYTLDIGIMI